MNLYETIFIARQDMAPSQVDSLADRYSSLIREAGGTVTKTEYCGLRTLTYPIKKNNKGHYVLMNIKASGEALNEIERQMRISDDVLRYLSVRVEAHQDGPSPLLKAARNSNIPEISMTIAEQELNPEDAAQAVEENE